MMIKKHQGEKAFEDIQAPVYLVKKDSMIPAATVIGSTEKNILVALCAEDKNDLCSAVGTWKYQSFS